MHRHSWPWTQEVWHGSGAKLKGLKGLVHSNHDIESVLIRFYVSVPMSFLYIEITSNVQTNLLFLTCDRQVLNALEKLAGAVTKLASPGANSLNYPQRDELVESPPVARLKSRFKALLHQPLNHGFVRTAQVRHLGGVERSRQQVLNVQR
jgi:hypothetical protein